MHHWHPRTSLWTNNSYKSLWVISVHFSLSKVADGQFPVRLSYRFGRRHWASIHRVTSSTRAPLSPDSGTLGSSVIGFSVSYEVLFPRLLGFLFPQALGFLSLQDPVFRGSCVLEFLVLWILGFSGPRLFGSSGSCFPRSVGHWVFRFSFPHVASGLMVLVSSGSRIHDSRFLFSRILGIRAVVFLCPWVFRSLRPRVHVSSRPWVIRFSSPRALESSDPWVLRGQKDAIEASPPSSRLGLTPWRMIESSSQLLIPLAWHYVGHLYVK